jgi:PPM family protein phosphatase
MKQATELRRRLELPISVGAASEIGLREQNQDCMTGFSSPFGAAYVVADGMGGYQGGADASRMVVDGFTRHLLAAPPTSPLRDAITLAVRLSNLEVIEKARSGDPAFAGMGSTIVVAVVRKSADRLELTTANVGDSRAYLQRGNELTLLTRDHTRAQWLADNGIIDAEAARTHPEASVLTRAIGHVTNLEVDISNTIPLVPGDGILLCSDGLSGFVPDAEILRTILLSADPADCVSRLVQLALGANSNDNITVQFLRIGHFTSADGRKLRETLRRGDQAAVPKRRRRGILSIAILFLILAGCAVGGYRLWKLRHRPPGPPAPDPVADLKTQVAKEQALCPQLTTEAVQDSGTDTDILKEPNGHHLPAALMNQVQANRSKFDSVTKQVGVVKVDLDNIAAKLSALSAGADRRKTLDGLIDKAKKDAESLAEERKELTSLENNQDALRHEVEAEQPPPPQQRQPQPPGSKPSPPNPPVPGPTGGSTPSGATTPNGKQAAPAPAGSPTSGTQSAPADGQTAPAKSGTGNSSPTPKPPNGSQPPTTQPKPPTSLQADADAPHELSNIH